MKFCADIFASLDMDVEIMLFISSLFAYLILQSLRNAHMEKRAKHLKSNGIPDNFKMVATPATSGQKPSESQDAPNKEAQNARYAEIEKELRTAFEAEDYVQVLKCWNALKRFNQCPPMQLLQVVKAMQCCNKGAYFIVMELRAFFKAHPKHVNVGLINDILEPLARRDDDAQLVDLIVRMLPSVNIVKDIRSYEILLAMHVGQKNFSKAQDVITEMQNMKVEFTPRASVAVLTIGLQLDNFDVVLKTFTRLQASWDVRSTWAVSPFALQSHKTRILMQIVDLACKKRKVHQLLPALEGMSIPDEVASSIQSQCASWSDIELVTMLKLLRKTAKAPQKDVIYNMLNKCVDSRSLKARHDQASSDISTSEGSRSDSEDESSNFEGSRSCGLSRPPGF